MQASQKNANAKQAKAAAASGGAPLDGDASVTLPDGTPASQFPVKPTGTDRRTVTQVWQLCGVPCAHSKYWRSSAFLYARLPAVAAMHRIAPGAEF